MSGSVRIPDGIGSNILGLIRWSVKPRPSVQSDARLGGIWDFSLTDGEALALRWSR